MEGGRFEAYIVYLAAACCGSHWKNIKLKAAKTGSQPMHFSMMKKHCEP
jgi:hypothetical protein